MPILKELAFTMGNEFEIRRYKRLTSLTVLTKGLGMSTSFVSVVKKIKFYILIFFLVQANKYHIFIEISDLAIIKFFADVHILADQHFSRMLPNRCT